MIARLEIKDLSVGYGATTVVHGVSLEVDSGELVVLLGANGSGKTSLLRSVTGVLPAVAGSVRLDGEPISGRSPEAVVRAGLSIVPEGRQLFGELSVRDNLLLGVHALRKRASRQRSRLTADLERVVDVFPDVGRLMSRRCEHLSGGQQQMVAIGRALMAEPCCLLLDEPSMGLAPKLVSDMLRVIAAVRDSGTAVLLVEQHAWLALACADRAYVMERGRIILSGDAGSIADDQRVRGAYLGRDEQGSQPTSPIGPGREALHDA